MDDSVVAGLKAALSNDNAWLEWSTIAVFLGVAIELFDLLIFNKEMGVLQRGILFVATILVAAGCGGEWIFEHKAAATEGRLQQISDEKVHALARAEAADNKIATQAADNAAKLGVKVDVLPTFVAAREGEIKGQITKFQTFATTEKKLADSVVAELNRDRTDLAQARTDAQAAAKAAEVELAKMRVENAPRTLTAQQQSDFINRLRSYSGLIVSVWRFQTTSTDTTPFSILLTNLLGGAEWKARGVSTSWGSGFAKGVIVLKRADAPPSASAAVNALIRELQSDNIAAGTAPDFTGTGGDAFGNGMIIPGPTPDIIVLVGDKS